VWYYATMSFGRGVLAGVVAVGVAAALGAGLAADGPRTLRVVLGVCAGAMLVVAALYVVDGYTEQAIGHVVAGVGLAVAAGAGDGVPVWLGVTMAATGVLLLLHDAVRRGGNGRPSV